MRNGDLIVLYPAPRAADLDAVRQDCQRLAAALGAEVSVGISGWHGGRGSVGIRPLPSCDESRPAGLVPMLRAYLDARFNLPLGPPTPGKSASPAATTPARTRPAPVTPTRAKLRSRNFPRPRRTDGDCRRGSSVAVDVRQRQLGAPTSQLQREGTTDACAHRDLSAELLHDTARRWSSTRSCAEPPSPKLPGWRVGVSLWRLGLGCCGVVSVVTT
jgi:hypothetical protein